MKKVNSRIWLPLITFLVGILICYYSLQFELLEIDLKFNVFEITISIITALIGLYIATTLSKSQSQNQKLAEFLQRRTEKLWIDFYSFKNTIEFQNTITISVLSKNFKILSIEIDSLKNIYYVFKLHLDLIEQLEQEIDNLQEKIEKSPISNNVISYQKDKESIIKKFEFIETLFANLFHRINQLN